MSRRRKKKKGGTAFNLDSAIREVAQMQMATQHIPGIVAQEVKKAWKQLPNTDPKRGPKSWFHDPLSLQYSLGYKDRRFSLTYETLRRVAGQLSIISAIINTRAAQVAAFAQPYRWTKSLGFVIRHKDPEHATTPAETAFIKELEAFILNCGRSETNQFSRFPRDDFEQFLRKIVRDSLIYDQACAVAGTSVELSDGTNVNIEDIEAGMQVRTHKGNVRTVLHPTQRLYSGEMVTVSARGQKLDVTAGHPLFVTKRNAGEPEWIPAGELKEGMYLTCLSPKEKHDWVTNEGYFCVRISDVCKATVELLPVYNLEVEEDHSYIGNGFINHNCWEIVPDRLGLPFEFVAVDASTIRIASDDRLVGTNTSYQNREGFVPDMPTRFMGLYEGREYGKEHPSGDPVAYVQVLNGQIENIYSQKELAFGVRNPRTDIYIQGYGFCLHPDARVHTTKGLIPVSQLVNTDFTVQIGGKCHAATAFVTGKKSVYKVTYKDGRELLASPDHQVYCLTDEGVFDWRRIEDIVEGDTVASEIDSDCAGSSFGHAEVTSVENLNTEIEMYDVSVDSDFHGFVVDGSVVHNSELEQLITVVTAHLNAELYNQKFFTQGSTPNGILNLRGDNYTPEMLEGFKRQWLAQVSGVENCLAPGARLLTKEKGEISIGDLVGESDEVPITLWTGTAWATGLAYRTKEKKLLCHTTLRNGLTLSTSPSHRFRVIGDDGYPTWKEQHQLVENDCVLVNKKQPFDDVVKEPDQVDETLVWLTSYGFELVSGVERTDEEVQMFDVSVNTEEHMFSANGILTHNSHRVPILQSEGVEWIDLNKTNSEMEFGKWMEYLIKIACFPPNQKVVMGDGTLCRIDKVIPGDFVRTHSGKIQQVKNVQIKKHLGDVVNIRVSGRTIQSTLEHPFLVASSWRPSKGAARVMGELAWKNASELGPDDYLVVPKPQPTKTPVTRIDLNKYVDSSIFEVGADRITLTTSNRARPIPRYLELTPENAFVFGLYLSEGCTGTNGIVSFTFAKDEQIHCDEVVSFAERHWMNSSYQENEKCNTKIQRFCSKPFASAFDSMFGHGSLNKQIPEELMNTTLEVQQALLSGLVAGDGCVDRRTTERIRFNTISHKLFEQVEHLFLLQGVYCQRHLRSGSRGGYENAHSIYTNEILGESARKAAIWLSGPKGTKLREITKGDPKISRRRVYDFPGYFLIPIKEKWVSTYEGNVFNLEVEDDHTYQIDRFAVHNCGVFLIDSAEINFDMHGGQNSAPMFESSNEWKIKASRDRGLKPILRFLAKMLNKNLIDKIDDHFTLEFVGLDELSENEKHELLVEQISSYMTLNEGRRQLDLPDLPGGDIPMNPVYIQAMAAGGEEGGGGEEAQPGAPEGDEEAADETPENGAESPATDPKYSNLFGLDEEKVEV